MISDVESVRYTIGILHPGAMGISVAESLIAAGNEVMWCSDGRSPESKERARTVADLVDTGWLNGLVNRSKLIISVVPPAAALDVAFEVSSLGYRGLYLDANAISPETARLVAREVESSGAQYIDGGIIGPPAAKEGSTRLYISGDGANTVSDRLNGGLLETIALEGDATAASSLKMAYAGWTKGSAALLAGVITLAESNGVFKYLAKEWDLSQPMLNARSDALGPSVAKAWRFAGEMEEIAKTFAEAGLPAGFHLAAAELYQQLETYKDDSNAPGGKKLALALQEIISNSRKNMK